MPPVSVRTFCIWRGTIALDAGKTSEAASRSTFARSRRRLTNTAEKVKLGRLRPDTGDIDVDIADGVNGETRLLGFFAFNLPGRLISCRPSKCLASRVEDRGREAMEAVVRRPQRMPPDGNNDRPVL